MIAVKIDLSKSDTNVFTWQKSQLLADFWSIADVQSNYV